VRITWSEIAQATFVRFMAGQAGMMAVNRAVEALADDPAPPGAFVRGAYCRLHVGSYRVLYEVEGDLITIVRIDRVSPAAHQFEQRSPGRRN
jgi:mRNA interferase RelE/StbE